MGGIRVPGERRQLRRGIDFGIYLLFMFLLQVMFVGFKVYVYQIHVFSRHGSPLPRHAFMIDYWGF